MRYNIQNSPQNDFLFKKIFAGKGNEDLLKDFLEAILNTKIDLKIVAKSVELTKNNENDKTGILDILAMFDVEENKKVKREITANIEMQVKNQRNIGERTLFYSSGLYYESHKEGENYDKNKVTIGICILSFELKKSNDYIYKAEMMTNDNHEVITDGIQLYYIQLPTFEKLKGKIKGRKKLEQWLNFISHRDKEAIKMAVKENDKVAKAENLLKNLRKTLSDPTVREEIRIREKHRMDYKNDMWEAKQEGVEQGRREAIIKNAKAMLEEGLSIEFIEKITKLDKKQIEKLARAEG